MYVSIVQGQLPKRSIYISANATFWLGGIQAAKHRTERRINQSPDRMHTSAQHAAGIWEVCTLAHLQLSAIYAYPSIPSQHLHQQLQAVVGNSKLALT